MTEPHQHRAAPPAGAASPALASGGRPAGIGDLLAIDHSVAHAARMYDYLVGGTTHFEIDRQAVERAAEAVGGIDNARTDALANRAFLGRAVRWLIEEGGVRQFLDIGTGVPSATNVPAVVRQIAPDARIVCVDNDPIVLAHAHQILGCGGSVSFIGGDLRDPGRILEAAARTIDFDQPVALLLLAVLHLVPDAEHPHAVVDHLVGATCPGSYLAVSHLTPDLAPEAMAALADRLNASARETFVMRDRAEISRFLDGLDLVEPGVVPIDRWRPDHTPPVDDDAWRPSFYGAIGRHRHPAERGRGHVAGDT